MLELKDLTIGYDKHSLFAPFTGAVSKGEVIFLMGRNGSGKSTLLKTIAGLLNPVSGTLNRKSQPVFLPASISVADTLTGLDIFEIYGAENGPIQDLALTKPFATLSSGEQKRILLAATLSHKTDLILLDEPFNFLDWSHALEFVQTIERERSHGRSFLIATHQLEWALKIENSNAWAIIDGHEKSSRMIISGTTKNVLISEEFQRSFGVGVQVLKNPLDSTHLLALSKLPKQV